MAVEGRMKYVKFLLFFFNLVFLLYGLAFIVMGVMLHVGVVTAVKVDISNRSAIACFVIGIITMFIAFMGCCGAWKENYCILTTFVVLQSIYLIVEILLAVAMGVVIYKLMDWGLQDMVRNYETKDEFKDLLDVMQQDMQCCGEVNASDWVDFQPDGMSVPDSCCMYVTRNCGAGAMLNSTIIYTAGCKTVMENNYKEIMLYAGVPVLLVAFFEILNLVLACVLRYGIRNGFFNVKVRENLP